MEEPKFHINVLELKAAELAIMSFTLKERDAISVHIRMDNMAALSYLMKMGGTKNQELTAISKEIWQYLFKRKITITVEYLPASMNGEADRESRQTRDSSQWKLNPTIFMTLCQIRGTPEVDLFASRVSHQLPHYISWKIDPFSQGRDAFQISWADKFVYAFPPFVLIGRILQKVNQDQCLMLIIMVSRAFNNVCKKSTVFASTQRSTERSCRKVESTRNSEFTATSGLDNLRQNLLAEGISERASSLITNNRRTSSIKHYESAWKKWCG